MVPPVTPRADEEYTKLLAFRTGLRQFLRWSEDQAATVGLTPAQHQLLLAIRGHPDSRGPSVGVARGSRRLSSIGPASVADLM